MASAEFSTGYSQGKPTSRVLQPPGGGSSNIFGGYDDHQTKNKGGAGEAASYKPKTTKDNIFGGPEEAENAAPAKQTTSTVFSSDPEPARETKQHPAGEQLEISPRKASGNPITGHNMTCSPRGANRPSLAPKGEFQLSPEKMPGGMTYSPRRGASTPNMTGDEISPEKPDGNPITGHNMTYSPQRFNRPNLEPKGSFNPITGEAYAPPQKVVHTSTKVRQPPGGASSGLW